MKITNYWGDVTDVSAKRSTTLQECCEPTILGTSNPLTAEQLMRARFTAYAMQIRPDFVVSSTHPENPSFGGTIYEGEQKSTLKVMTHGVSFRWHCNVSYPVLPFQPKYRLGHPEFFIIIIKKYIYRIKISKKYILFNFEKNFTPRITVLHGTVLH